MLYRSCLTICKIKPIFIFPLQLFLFISQSPVCNQNGTSTRRLDTFHRNRKRNQLYLLDFLLLFLLHNCPFFHPLLNRRLFTAGKTCFRIKNKTTMNNYCLCCPQIKRTSHYQRRVTPERSRRNSQNGKTQLDDIR